MTTTKWTRKQVLGVAARLETVHSFNVRDGVAEAAAMLRDLAPPEEPRTWKVGDLLKHNDIVWTVVSIRGDFVDIRTVFGADRWGCPSSSLKDAIPMKLVEDKG